MVVVKFGRTSPQCLFHVVVMDVRELCRNMNEKKTRNGVYKLYILKFANTDRLLEMDVALPLLVVK